jgi:hypothetical protein
MKTTDFINARAKKTVEEAVAPIVAAPVVESIMPEFTFESAESKYNELLEDATGGSSCSSVIATTVETLGEKGSFSKKDVNKKLTGYGNMLTRGGPVKVGK